MISSKKYIKCKVADCKKDLKIELNKLKNQITHLTRLSKKSYYDQYFTNNKRNLQKIWKGIKEIINIKSQYFDHPTCLLDDGQTITDPTKMANAFNGYFTSIVDEIKEKRKFEGNKSFRDYLTNHINNLFLLYDCDEAEIKSIIKSLNTRIKSNYS